MSGYLAQKLRNLKYNKKKAGGKYKKEIPGFRARKWGVKRTYSRINRFERILSDLKEN